MDFITTCKQTMTPILPQGNKKKDTPNELTKPTQNEVDPHSEEAVPLPTFTAGCNFSPSLCNFHGRQYPLCVDS